MRLAFAALVLSLVTACASSPGPVRNFHGSGPVDTGSLIARSSDHQKVGRPYTISGRRYVPRRDDTYDEVGIASWYGPNFHGRPTANGERFDQHQMTAAHTTLPIPSIVEVTNLENGRQVIVRLNDRGPFVDDRIIDLSTAAAEALDYRRAGLARVRVRYLGPAHANGAAPQRHMAHNNRATPRPTPPVPVPAPTPVPAPLPQPVQVAEFQPDPTPVHDDFNGELRSAVPLQPVTLQVGAFSERLNAERFAQRLNGAGDVWVAAGSSNGRQVYRVFVGRWSDRERARQALAHLENWGVFDARIVSLN